jgi:hypothetical protein
MDPVYRKPGYKIWIDLLGGEAWLDHLARLQLVARTTYYLGWLTAILAARCTALKSRPC